MKRKARSTRTHHIAIVLALGAVPLLAACGGEQKKAAVAPTPPPAPAPAPAAAVAPAPAPAQPVPQTNPEFARAVGMYAQYVAVAGQLDGAPQDEALRSSIELLAQAIEKAPRTGGIDTVAYAGLIRGEQPSSAVGYVGGDPLVADIRSLAAAAQGLDALASVPYSGNGKVRGAVNDFQSSVRELQGTEILRIDRGKIVDALKKAETALRAMNEVPAAAPG